MVRLMVFQIYKFILDENKTGEKFADEDLFGVGTEQAAKDP